MFNTISKKLANAGRGAVRGTQKLAGSVTLSAQIEESRKQIQNYYTQLGKACYERYRDHAAPEFQEICQAIALEEQKISRCEEEIRILRGVRRCPQCGADVDKDSIFCGSCGFRLPPIQAPVQQSAGGLGQRESCPQCGAMVEEDAFFCTECGCRLPGKESPSVPDGRKECPVCGNHVEDMALFCNVCGAKLEQEAYQEPLPLFTEAEEPADEPWVSSEAEEKEEDAEKEPEQTV